MKTFNKISLLRILSILVMIFLTSCSTSTPKIYIKSGDLSMNLKQEAYLVNAVAISTDGRYGASAGWEDAIIIWDLQTGKQIRRLVGHTSMVNAVAFSPDNKHIISGGNDKAVRLWDTATGKELKQFIGHNCGFEVTCVHTLAFSSDGKKVLSGGVRDIKLWDVETGRAIKTLDGTFPATISADDKYILFTRRKDLVIWDIAAQKEIKKFVSRSLLGGHRAGITALAMSPDNKYAVSGSLSGVVKFWDLSSGNEIKTFEKHPSINGVRSIAYTPDGENIISGGGDCVLRLWNVSTGQDVKQFVGHSHLQAVAVILPNGKYVLSGGSDGSVRLWDVDTGEDITTMIGFENGEWIVITKKGYYNASENGGQYLNVNISEKSYSVDKFYDVFYRPDIVAATLRGEDISGLVTITMNDAIKNPPPVVDFNTIPVDTNTEKVKVCYSAKDTGGGIGEVRLFHNGKLIQSDGYYKDVAKATSGKAQLVAMGSKDIYEDMRNVSIKGKVDTTPTASKSKGNIFEDCKDVEAISGENEVSITAFNSSNTVQSYMKTVNFTSKIKSEESHLYILVVGIDKYKDTNVNLKYAVKDATDIEEKIKVQAATLYNPRNIHYEHLTDREATKANITRKIDVLMEAIKPQDSFILFVAGHGVLLQNQYYMLTHDYKGTINDNSMISSNEIVEMSKKIKSLNQLFIFDTCHAGGVDTIVSGLYDARMSVLAKKMGLHIYASASDKQAAMDGYKGNGLFTYTLLDGLNNNRQADKNKDGKVSIVGLGEYSKKMTTNISKKIGHEQTPLIINFGKDSPIYKLQ